MRINPSQQQGVIGEAGKVTGYINKRRWRNGTDWLKLSGKLSGETEAELCWFHPGIVWSLEKLIDMAGWLVAVIKLDRKQFLCQSLLNSLIKYSKLRGSFLGLQRFSKMNNWSLYNHWKINLLHWQWYLLFKIWQVVFLFSYILL